jgi:hypothetical protein
MPFTQDVAITAFADTRNSLRPPFGVTPQLLWLWLWHPCPNGCLQQIAANRFSIPQDVIAILLQGFVRHS